MRLPGASDAQGNPKSAAADPFTDAAREILTGVRRSTEAFVASVPDDLHETGMPASILKVRDIHISMGNVIGRHQWNDPRGRSGQEIGVPPDPGAEKSHQARIVERRGGCSGTSVARPGESTQRRTEVSHHKVRREETLIDPRRRTGCNTEADNASNLCTRANMQPDLRVYDHMLARADGIGEQLGLWVCVAFDDT